MLTRRSKRSILALAFTALLVLLISFSLARFFSAREERRRYEEEKALIVEPEPNVFTVALDSRERERRYAAELRPWTDAQIPAEVSGVILSAPVEPGTKVQAGDVLAELDPRLADLDVEAARARHAENERLRAEAETLSARNVGARTELDAATAREAVSRAELASAEERLRRHTVRAPFDGIVNERLVEPGDAIAAYQPVVELVDLSRHRVVFYVVELDLPSLLPDTEVRLRLPGAPAKIYTPKVRFVAGAADRATRLFRVEAVLEGADDLPGRLQGIVEARVQPFRDMPFIPAAAVAITGRQPSVEQWVGEGEIRRVPVDIGPEIDGSYPVFSGLEPGDRILIR